MAFAILRYEKLKTLGNVAASLSHNYRLIQTLNADPLKSVFNEHQIESKEDVLQLLKSKLPLKMRKNAVPCIEFLITASPEWSGWGTDNEKAFFEKSIEWIKDQYGSENLITTSIHRDETTPHMVAYLVPYTRDGRLSAKDVVGGRANMSSTQTSFASAVASFGLQRGLEGSRAEHQTIQKYYQSVNELRKIDDSNIFNEVVFPKKCSFWESSDAYANRVSEAIMDSYNDSKNMILKENYKVKELNRKLKNEIGGLKYKLRLADPFFDYEKYCDDDIAQKMRDSVIKIKEKFEQDLDFNRILKEIEQKKTKSEQKQEHEVILEPIIISKKQSNNELKRDDSLGFSM